MKKKIILILIVIFILATSYFVFFYNSFSGLGTKDNPYKIFNVKDLQKLSSSVNRGLRHYKNQYFALMSDIDFNGEKYNQIGNDNNTFQGFFDGNNYTIKNVVIENNYQNVGFFGRIESDKEVKLKNIKIDNITINSLNKEANAVGGLIGLASNVNIENCDVIGHVNLIDTFSYSIGGIVGSLKGNIKDCTFDGDIYFEVNEYYQSNEQKEKWSFTGGIIGDIKGNAFNLTNKGKIIFADSKNKESENTRIYYTTGGIIGRIYESDEVVNCINYGKLRTLGNVAGIIGDIGDNTTVKKCFNYGNIQSSGELTLNAGGITAFALHQGEITNCGNYGDINILTLPNKFSNEIVSVYQSNFIGGIMGSGYFNISMCFNKGNINIEGVNLHYAGGIVGTGSGKVYNCYNQGMVSAISSKNTSMAGGINSALQDNINNSYTDTDVKIGIVENCYNTGIVLAKKGIGGAMSSNQLAGAIIGFNMSEYTTIKNTFFDQQVIDEYISSNDYSLCKYWYGEEFEAENINGEKIMNNFSLPTTSFFDKENLPSFGEFISIDDLKNNSNNVWIFSTDNYPKLYFEEG